MRLQLSNLLLASSNLHILRLQFGVQLIDALLQLLIQQRTGSQLLGECIVGRRICRRWRGHGIAFGLRCLRRCDNRLDAGKRGRLCTRIRFIGGQHDTRRPRRVDQHRVLTQQTAIGLIELHKEIQKGFVDWFA
ncbi:hypothetical protein D3C81_1258380 [compost metagenome]